MCIRCPWTSQTSQEGIVETCSSIEGKCVACRITRAHEAEKDNLIVLILQGQYILFQEQCYSVVTPGWHTGQLFHSRRELPGFQRKGILCAALGKWYILPSATITTQVDPESTVQAARGDSSGISPSYSYQIYFRHKKKGRYVNSNVFVTCPRKKLAQQK